MKSLRETILDQSDLMSKELGVEELKYCRNFKSGSIFLNTLDELIKREGKMVRAGTVKDNWCSISYSDKMGGAFRIQIIYNKNEYYQLNVQKRADQFNCFYNTEPAAAWVTRDEKSRTYQLTDRVLEILGPILNYIKKNSD